MKKLAKNKTAKGLVSLITIIILLSSVLSASLLYDNKITANVVKETSINYGEKSSIKITEVNDINDLSQLNEGWYEIRNGFVFYLETFNSYVPLYTRVLNPEQQNGLLAVDEEGNLRLEKKVEYAKNEIPAEKIEEKSVATTITGKVTGMERVSGFAGGSNTKIYEATLNGKTVTIPGEFSSQQDAKKAVISIHGISNIREQRIPQSSGTKFNVFDGSGNYLGDITAIDEVNVYSTGEILASMKNTQLGRIYYPQFKVSASLISEYAVTASNIDEARKKFQYDWGVPPTSINEIKYQVGETIPSGSTYFLINKDTNGRLATLPNVDPNNVQGILDNYQKYSKFSKMELELVKAPTIDDLTTANLGVPIPILQKELQAYNAIPKIEPEEQIKSPVLYKVNIWDKKAYYVNNNRYENEGDASAALAKAKQDYNTAIMQRYAKDELTKSENRDKQLTGEITPDGELLLKDSKKVYKFVPKTDTNGNVLGVTLQSVGDPYKTLQMIGDVKVIRTIEIQTGKVTEIEITKGDKSATVDEETIKRIKESGGNGFSIKSEGKDGKNGDPNLPQILEFIDPKTNLLLERQTLSLGYDATQSGTKTTEKFGTLYYYNGNEITKAEYDKLKTKDKSNAAKKDDVPIFKVTEEKKDGAVTFLTTYQFETIFDNDKKPIITYEAVKIDQKTGNVVEFIYGEGDKTIKINTPEGIGAFDFFKNEYGTISEDSDLRDKVITRLNQFKSQQFFATVERIFTEFQGLGYYATFFFDHDSLLEWRENVDRAFATLYLGTEYWSSAICSQYLDGQNKGIAYAETPQGLAQVAAHIEATRSEQIITPTGREFNYKITFNVRNGDFEKDLRAPEEMRINVILKGERTATVFRQDQVIKRGSSFGRAGRSAIAKSSTAFYNQVCLKFDKIPLKWKIDDKELCNTIQESAGAATSVGTATTTASGGGGGTGEINDF